MIHYGQQSYEKRDSADMLEHQIPSGKAAS